MLLGSGSAQYVRGTAGDPTPSCPAASESQPAATVIPPIASVPPRVAKGDPDDACRLV
jgi:hypothetical protein